MRTPSVGMLAALFATSAMAGTPASSSAPGRSQSVFAALTQPRTFVSPHYALELDGKSVGWLKSFEGGHATSDVVAEKPGKNRGAGKRIAGVKYEDITLTFGTGMSKGLYEWIKASLANRFVRKNGAIINATYDNKEISRLEFYNAIITEVALPALDAASKDTATIRLRISPETTRTKASPGGGRNLAGAYPVNAAKQKKWLPAHFKLAIDGLGRSCAKVSKIGALVFKRKAAHKTVGELRDYSKEPADVQVANLVITLPQAYAADFNEWKQRSVDARRSSDTEKNGTLTFMAPDMRTALFTVGLEHLGIVKLTQERPHAQNDQLPKVTVEMYMETMKFNYAAGTAWR